MVTNVQKLSLKQTLSVSCGREGRVTTVKARCNPADKQMDSQTADRLPGSHKRQ